MPELESLARSIVNLFKLSWLQDIDLLTDRDGGAQITEVNPRPSGGVVAAAAAGIDILDDLVSLAKGETIPAAAIRGETTVLPYQAVMAVSRSLRYTKREDA